MTKLMRATRLQARSDRRCGGGTRAELGRPQHGRVGRRQAALRRRGEAGRRPVTETGSTLLYPLFNLWASGYNEKYSSTTIQTAGTGSGTGISDATNGTIDIGASDAYLSPSEVSASPHLKNIPLAISAQLVAYNVPGITAHLKLSGKLLSQIYSGTVTNWNASQIASANPGVTLPNLPIVTLHRSDSSGDTFLFTTYLSKADPSGWGAKIGFNTTVPWPNAPGALGESGNSGMVSGCKATPGCIAYIGISYQTQVLQAGLGYAALRQRQGPVRPADADVDRRRGGRLREEDPGQRDHLPHLRPDQRRLPDHQLRVRHRVERPVVLLGRQEHPVGAGVGDQPEAGLGDARTCRRWTSSRSRPRSWRSRSSRS